MDISSGAGKRTRARLPKVKTGCFTCRARRVKCDETKPACTRCWKLGINCGGYSKPDSQPQASYRRIVPKDTKDSLTVHRGIRAGPRFASENEGRYFRYYCEDIAVQLAGPVRTILWNRLIPQVGEMEGFIRHAIIALGALSKSRVSTAECDSHYEYALIQYGKALKGVQSALENKVRNFRTAYISSILVYCFESMAGHQASASLHACGAVNLLYRWSIEEGAHNARRETYSEKSSRTDGWNPSRPEPMNEYGGKNGRDARNMHPASCAMQFRIEEELHSAISTLDLQSLLFLDIRPIRLHRELVGHMTESVKTMPSQFVDLRDCRAFLQLIMRRNFHFMTVARSDIQIIEKPVHLNSKDAGAMTPANSIWATTTSKSISPQEIPLALSELRDQYNVDIDRWKLASSNLFERTFLLENGLQDFIQSSLLKIHAALNVVTLARTFFPPETEYDAYLPEYRTITELSALIHPHLLTSSMFSFDLGIIAALSQAAGSCRDSIVRHQAVDLLLKSPEYCEGVWNSRVVGKISEAMVNIEEEWMDEDGNIPGNRRVYLLRVDYNPTEQKAVPVLRQRTGTDREEDVVDIKVELRW